MRGLRRVVTPVPRVTLNLIGGPRRAAGVAERLPHRRGALAIRGIGEDAIGQFDETGGGRLAAMQHDARAHRRDALGDDEVIGRLRQDDHRHAAQHRLVRAVDAAVRHEQIGAAQHVHLRHVFADEHVRGRLRQHAAIDAMTDRHHDLIRLAAERLEARAIERRFVVVHGAHRHVDQRAVRRPLRDRRPTRTASRRTRISTDR